MRSLLGVFMVLAVSADEDVTIEGVAGDSVLLPCISKGRNAFKGFHWQLDADEPVFIINQSSTGVGYEGRAKIFVNDRENCSLHLSNIATKDTGKYRCAFDNQEPYDPFYINLNVFSHLPMTDGCIRFFKIIPMVLLHGFCLVCGAMVRE